MTETQGKHRAHSPAIDNRKARFNYEILETLEAGIMLLGSEVKSLRAGKCSLDGSYVRMINGEAFLVGATIAEYEQAGPDNHDPDRKRKLLLHKREANRLLGKVKEQRLTIVPLRLYFGPRGFAKVLIGLAKGKASFDKREKIRERTTRRDIERQMKRRR